MVGHTFTGRLWEHVPDQPGTWHFLTLPGGLADDLVAESGPRHGFGSIRVEASIGATTWHTSLFPDAGRGSLLLPVKKQVRLTERLDAGAICVVALRLAI